MPCRSARALSFDPNLRCPKVYPVSGSLKNIGELKTVGFKLSRHQGIPLARLLLAASQEWENVDVTAYRSSQKSSDGTFHVAVTHLEP